MQQFAALYTALDETTSTNEKIAALAGYFAAAPPADAAWALFFLSGRKLRQFVPTSSLRAWATEQAAIPAWLFEESYDAVGDLAETIALLLPDNRPQTADHRPPQYAVPSVAQAVSGQPSAVVTIGSLSEWVELRLLPLRGQDEATQRAAVLAAWQSLSQRQRLVWNKLITGSFRVGVSQLLVTRALASVSGLAADAIAHRLMGEWQPSAAFFAALLAADTSDSDASRPYPFFLASALEDQPASLGVPADWQAEWKWDGIRAQLIRRQGRVFLWSRGEELITERFPELAALGELLPDGCVIDGEVLPWRADQPLPFAVLQQRIGRKTLTKKVLAEAPVVLLAYDLLEDAGNDIRTLPLHERRARLEALVATRIAEYAMRNAEPERARLDSQRSAFPLLISPLVPIANWQQLAATWAEARERQTEGLMLKRRESPYRVGRQRGDWWKWKVNPYTIDAVLLYAQRGTGKRASLYSDYTFGLWENGQLVPFAKAYSGLTDAEIRQVDAFVRRSTLEKFGPVRTVRPELVFELAFEGIQRSPRHKSGVAVRFPRMLRWRHDKLPAEADSLATLRALLPAEE